MAGYRYAKTRYGVQGTRLFLVVAITTLPLSAATFATASLAEPESGHAPPARPAPGFPSFRMADLACAHCKRPILENYVTVRGKAYHESCFLNQVAPKCTVCARPITGTHYKDAWGHPFHAEHKDLVPQCGYCSRIMSPRSSRGGWRYGDGRLVCGLCVESAVNDLPEARKLARRARGMLETLGLKLPYGEIPLEIGDRNWLAAIRTQRQTLSTGTEATAFTSTVTRKLGAKVVSKEVAMYALDGMPRDVFQGTIAHELMHAWNFLNGQFRHAPALEEGSANFVETLVLERLGTPLARYQIQAIARSEDPVYGGGYRRVKRLVADHGLAVLLDTLKSEADFPAGY